MSSTAPCFAAPSSDAGQPVPRARSAAAANDANVFMADILSTPVRNDGRLGGRERPAGSGSAFGGGRDRFTPRRQHDDPCHRLPAYTDNSRTESFAGASPWESLRL